MKKFWLLIGFMAMEICMTGCGANQNGAVTDNQTQTKQVNPMDVNYILDNVNNQNVNENKKLTISIPAEKLIKQMDEVEDAKVIIAEENAYVAIKISRINQEDEKRTNNMKKDRYVDLNGNADDGNLDSRIDENNNSGTVSGRDDYTRVTGSFEDKIVKRVREAGGLVRNVYVSVDPEIYKRMNTFENTIRETGSNANLYKNFQDMANDFFGPNN